MPLEREPIAHLQRDFAKALIERAEAPSGLAPARRFSVYRNTVFASLTAVLRARYPVVLRLVGEEFFLGVAREFIAKAPPNSPVLIEYGAGFPGFLQDFEPSRALGYLPDVARLEWLRHLAYHALDAKCLAAERLSSVPAEAVGGLTFTFHPSAHLIGSPYPIVGIWRTNTFDEEVRSLGPDLPGEAALVVRPGFEVQVIELNRGEHAFASALMAGDALAAAAGKGQAFDGFEVAQALAKLIAARAFNTFHLTPPRSQGETPHE